MKFIPFEKLSKKEQKKRNAQKRGNWGKVNPTTKFIPSKKQYNRKKVNKNDLPFFHEF
jgi:hypothetical protein